MKKFFKSFALAAGVFTMIFLMDFPKMILSADFFYEAEAVVIVHARPAVGAAVVTAAVVTTAVVASSSAHANAAAQANANAAAQANQAAAQAKAQQPPPGAPAVGTIVTTLPAGCTQTKLNKVDYMRCGTTYYKPAMVGDKVVFVVSQP